MFRNHLAIAFAGLSLALTTSADIISNFPASSNATVDVVPFLSAIQRAASISIEVQQLATTPAVPIPSNLTSLPSYSIVNRLVSALPIVQDGILHPDTEVMIQKLKAANDTGAPSSLTARQSALRVMVVGDSMTQGQQGDWTWRYRIWQWFQQNGVAVNFVGPITGTIKPQSPHVPQPPPLFGDLPPSTETGNNGGYARGVDSAFLQNNNHFAYWGRAAAQDQGIIEEVVAQHPADLMLLMLGFNDMGWFYSDAEGTIDSIGNLIANARKSNPDLKFAVANVPNRKFIGGRQDLVDNTRIYNGLLPDAINKWSTKQSPIHLVRLEENYVCQPDDCPAGEHLRYIATPP